MSEMTGCDGEFMASAPNPDLIDYMYWVGAFFSRLCLVANKSTSTVAKYARLLQKWWPCM